MKKEMLSLNSMIAEAVAKKQSLDDFLLEYNTRELECSAEGCRDAGERHGCSGRKFLCEQ